MTDLIVIAPINGRRTILRFDGVPSLRSWCDRIEREHTTQTPSNSNKEATPHA